MKSTNSKKFQSITKKVLTKIIIIYLLAVIILTSLHFVLEFYLKKDGIRVELTKISDAFYPAIQKALWDMDESQIDLILKGIMKISIIQGVEVFDKKNNQTIKTIFSNQIDNTKERDFFYQIDIFKEFRNSKEYLATISFFSTSDVIFQRIKDGFLLMLISSLIKSLLLIGLLFYLIRKIIIAPLESLTKEVEKINLHNKDIKLITHNSKTEDEFSILKDSFNNMIKKYQEQKEHMQNQAKLAQMGEMIKMIAHQWRQPLTAISSTAGALSLKITMDRYDKEFFFEQVTNISNYASHLSATIDDFRNFFKTNKLKEHIILKDIINDTLKMLGNSLKNKNITLKSQFDCEHVLYTYPNELKQVILNLIKNAEDVLIEKNVKNATICVNTYDKDDLCHIEVKDNGGGIDTSIIDRIFEPYFTTKSKRDGTGLGLYMSKTIVEKHCKGKLEVYNDNDGAVFTIALRRVDE